MKRVVLWGWSEADQIKAVDIFQQRTDVKVVDWVADINIAHKKYIDFLYNAPNFDQISLIRRAPASMTADELLKFLDMFSREKRSKGMDLHEQLNVAKNYFRYFLWMLESKDVTHVLFSIVPIIGFDYLCYLAAKRLKLSVTMCYQSIFPDKFFFCHTLEDFGSFKEVKSKEIVTKPKIDWGFKKDLFYMKGTVRMNRQVSPWARLIRETMRYGLRKSSKPMRYSGVVENFIQAKEFQTYYPQFAKQAHDISIEKKYAYFPLHLQPELTTTGLGGGYSDQLDAIERLSEMLPKEWLIYVKENPKQGHEQRAAEFFRRLAAIDKVVYVGKEVDTYWLMHHSQFVATITGTAGWESITGGKPCLIFGLAWYESLPGVVRYTPSTTLENVLGENILKTEQISALDALLTKTRMGILDKVYNAIYPNYNSQQNAEKIALFLEEVVSEQGHHGE